MTEFYDRQGNPISLGLWMLHFHDKDYQIVEQTKIGDVMVSTVWLGSDYSFGHGPIVIFETMIFGPDDEYEEMYRYSTEEEALENHRKLVAQFELLAAATGGDDENLDRASPARPDVRGEGGERPGSDQGDDR